MNFPNQAQIAAFGRHVLTFAAGGVTFAATLHLITSDQASTISDSLNHIATGITQIVIGVGPLVALVSAAYSAISAGDKARLASVAKIPDTTVVTTPNLAKEVPAANVVSNAEHEVVPPPTIPEPKKV